MTLATATATAPAMSTYAQTNAAAMAIRARMEGTSPEGPDSPQSQRPGALPPGPGQPISPELSSGKIDTRYIAGTPAIVVVARPAQFLASPIGQLFPYEVASAAGLQHLGFDAAEMDEVVGFGDVSNPTAPAYGVTFKFKNPIRATSIAPAMRAHAQLADLGGKKYLRSAAPMMSLYGPNNKTLVAATDAALHQMVENASQPQTGPLMDRVREGAAGSDLYVAADVVSLQPFIQLFLAQAQAIGKSPPAARQVAEKLKLVSAFELTLNVSNSGPTSLVLHCTDDAAAQTVDSSIQEILQKARTARQTEQPGGGDQVSQAMDRYQERMLALFQPQRSGTSISCIHMDGQNPAQQKLVELVVASGAMAAVAPAIQAARNAAMKASSGPGPGGPADGPAGPAPPGAPGTPVEPARQ